VRFRSCVGSAPHYVPEMETLAFGNAGFDVSQLCLGTWNMYSKADWGPADEAACHHLIQHAVDGGCRFIDTARGYGDSEEIVGRALKGRRDRVVLASKVVHCDPEQVGPAIDTSLANLQTDYIDLYICHWPSPSHSLQAFFEEMIRQREAGKIRAIGVSNFDLAQMRVAVNYGVVSLQPPFSLLWRIEDELLAFCRAAGIALTPYSPLAQGLLTGRYTRQSEAPTGPRRGNVLFSDRIFPRACAVAREVDAIADRLGLTSSQVALAWCLQTPGVTCPIVGASSIQQWDANVGALDIRLADDDYARLDEQGRQVWDLVGHDATMWGWRPK